jgi:sugar phosphate isomerase/epimerase
VEELSNLGIATGAFIVERDDWDASVAKAAAIGYQHLELTAITLERLDQLLPFLAQQPAALDSFERVSIHAPAGEARESTQAVIAELASLNDTFDIVLHPDVYVGEPSVMSLGGRAVFENMDCQKDFGRTTTDLESVFGTFPAAGFCLDVAHVRTNDPTLGLAHELLDSLGARLRQLHISGIEGDGTHRTTTTEDLKLYEPVLARCRHVPWLLETELVQ